MIYRHAELLVETFADEYKGMREIRKHVAWYFKGYPVGGELRAGLEKMRGAKVLLLHKIVFR